MDILKTFESQFKNQIIRRDYEIDIEEIKKAWIRLYINISNRKDIIVNDSIKKTWNNIIRYAYNQECDYDNLKSLYLCGNTGSGKSTTMKTLHTLLEIEEMKYWKNNIERSFVFKFISANQIVELFADNGFEGIANLININSLCIDDVGSENEVNYFGNKLCVVSHLIERRYDKNLFTHFTSNFKIKDLKYGERVVSRLCEMSNEIVLAGSDFRMD